MGDVLGLEARVETRASGDDVEAALEVVEHLVLGRQVLAGTASCPADVSGGEHRMRLVEADVVIGVVPHAARTATTIHEQETALVPDVLARDRQGVEPGDARAQNHDVIVFDGLADGSSVAG